MVNKLKEQHVDSVIFLAQTAHRPCSLNWIGGILQLLYLVSTCSCLVLLILQLAKWRSLEHDSVLRLRSFYNSRHSQRNHSIIWMIDLIIDAQWPSLCGAHSILPMVRPAICTLIQDMKLLISLSIACVHSTIHPELWRQRRRIHRRRRCRHIHHRSHRGRVHVDHQHLRWLQWL